MAGHDDPRRTRVLLVEDHTIVRQGLRLLLSSYAEFEVVGEAGSGHEALDAAGRLGPGLVVLDLTLPDRDGLEVLRELRRRHPETRVVILSMHAGSEYVRPALQAGAAGYLVKGADVGDLVSALRAACRGEVALSPAVTRAALMEPADASAEVLSDREREVLGHVARGLTSREIAERLGIRSRTVECHRQNLMDKLDIHDVAGLTRYALKTGLISPEE